MFEKMIEQAISWVFDTGVNLLVALLILLIGLKLIKKVRTIADRTMEKAGVETTLRRFLNALLYALMIGILIFVVAGEIGIEVTSLVALVGSVGLALSLAMEKSLANFAGGVMVLLLKPFKAGDFISTPDGAGVVESIGLVYTTLVTADNQKISIPNSNMTTNVVTNVTGVEKRKVVLSVGIGYAADLRKAKEVAQRVLENNEFIINEDGLQVVVAELGPGVLHTGEGVLVHEGLEQLGQAGINGHAALQLGMLLGGGELLVQVSGDVGGEILAVAVGLARQHLVQLVDLGVALVLVAPDLLEL
ncbi:MAG: mechanosensitive ion channel family protein, partial [Lachnospiraceae bacterium]|nr:mechanosensitive ion channel family protein [Lachnospiraceae bacterium]